jgi:hypothetical protein
MRFIYTSLKTLWVGGSLAMLSFVPSVILDARKGQQPLYLIVNSVVFCSYLLSFFLGNLGYLRETYSGQSPPPARLARRISLDLILLAMHVIAFGGMALSLDDCRAFDAWLLFLLMTDVWWWVYEPRSRPTMLRRVWQILAIPVTEPQASQLPVAEPYPARTWILNNLASAAILCACMKSSGLESCLFLNVATALVSFLSRTVDFKKTRFWMF